MLLDEASAWERARRHARLQFGMYSESLFELVIQLRCLDSQPCLGEPTQYITAPLLTL